MDMYILRTCIHLFQEVVEALLAGMIEHMSLVHLHNLNYPAVGTGAERRVHLSESKPPLLNTIEEGKGGWSG